MDGASGRQVVVWILCPCTHLSSPSGVIIICFLQTACARGTRRRRLHLWGACDPGCAATREKTQSCAAEPEACWSPPLPPPPRASSYHPWGARPPWHGAVSASGSRPGRRTLLAGGSGRLRGTASGRAEAAAACAAAGATAAAATGIRRACDWWGSTASGTVFCAGPGLGRPGRGWPLALWRRLVAPASESCWAVRVLRRIQSCAER